MQKIVRTPSFTVVRILPDVYRFKIAKIVLRKFRASYGEFLDYFFYELSGGQLVYNEEQLPATFSLEGLVATHPDQQSAIDELNGLWKFDSEKPPEQADRWVIDLKGILKDQVPLKLSCYLAEPFLI